MLTRENSEYADKYREENKSSLVLQPRDSPRSEFGTSPHRPHLSTHSCAVHNYIERCIRFFFL